MDAWGFKNFKLVLLYKATRDGFESTSFHSKVNGVSNTVFIGTTESGVRFGGFTVVPFIGSGNYKEDTSLKSFIFSLTKKAKYSLTKKEKAIWDSSSYGPFYGNYNIYICNNSNTTVSSYSHANYEYALPEPLFVANSKMRELEVYKI